MTLDFRISGVMLVQGSVKMVVLGGCSHRQKCSGELVDAKNNFHDVAAQLILVCKKIGRQSRKLASLNS